MLFSSNLFHKIAICFQSKHLFCSLPRHMTVLSILKNPNINEQIRIKGWIKSLRRMKEHVFIDVNDGSCAQKLQAVFRQEQKSSDLSVGASVILSGLLNVSPKGQLELNAEHVEICGACVIADGYPFAPKKSYPPEYIRQYLHFRPRTDKFSSLLRIRNYLVQTIHNYFYENDYVLIHTPILTSNDCEGAGEVFSVQPENKETLKSMIKPNVPLEEAYFGTKVYLTVSGQLHLEAAAHSLSNVYCFGPTFRAENSKSRLHLSEFYMLEAECAFINKIEEIASILEKLIKNVTHRILDKCNEDVRTCSEEEVSFNWLNKPFITFTYDEAAEILNNNRGKYKGEFKKEMGLTKEHEKYLVKYCDDTPTFVINWPKNLKPFYMKDCNDDESKVAALDLLVPNIGELAGGSLRENNYELLKKKLPPGKTDLDWYLELRKFGGVPTGGFGLGFERYLQFLLGISNIKDTIPFPRWPHNCRL